MPAEPQEEALELGLRDLPLFLFIRGLTALVLVTALVVVAHLYIGSRVIDGAGLPQVASSVLWGGLWAAPIKHPSRLTAGGGYVPPWSPP